MKFGSNTLVWVAFMVASLLTAIVYATLWSEKWYWVILSILGISSVVLAVMMLQRSGFMYWAVASVALGLLIGQWWFLEFMAAQILWSVRGFAP